MPSSYRKHEVQKRYRESLAREPAEEGSELARRIFTLTGRTAVVGLILRENNQKLEFLLSYRAADLKEHPSQVALPGGLVDDNESPLGALKREIFEETGILQQHLEVEEKPWEFLISKSGHKVLPFLCFLSEEGFSDAEIKNSEIAEAAWLPFDALFAGQLWSKKRVLSFQTPVWNGWKHETWGLTAGILAHFVARISGSFPY